MPVFDSPCGQLVLNTWPNTAHSNTQPWNAADEYLLSRAPEAHSKVLVINDNWGALTCGLANQGHEIHCYTDSYCSRQAILENLQQGDLTSHNKVDLLNDITQPNEASYDAVYIQQPKSFDSLQYWLNQLIKIDTGIIHIAGMAKHFPVKWLNWLEQHGNDYQQGQIKKKARLISLRLPEQLPAFSEFKGYHYNGDEYLGLPGVFCRDHLDIGSQVLLDHLPADISGHVIDLGCGNGLLSKEIKKAFPKVTLTLCDDSAVAIKSAQINLSHEEIAADFHHTDVLNGVAKTADWIICNPPFHKGNQVLTDIAQRMFDQSSQLLTKKGHLLVIANRHLPYGKDLKRHFGGYQILHNDARFTLYLCQKR